MTPPEIKPGWHGYSIGNRTLSIGKLPGRTQFALYMTEGSGAHVTPLAYFRSESKARTALEMLDKLVQL
jgi:hypothetical protein